MAIARCLLYAAFLFLSLIMSVGRLEACAVPGYPSEDARTALERAIAVGVVEVEQIIEVEDGLQVNLLVLDVIRGGATELSSIQLTCRDCRLGSAREGANRDFRFYAGMLETLLSRPDCSVDLGLVIGRQYVFVKSSPMSRFVMEPTWSGDPWLRSIREYFTHGLFEPLNFIEYLAQVDSYSVVNCEAGPFRNNCQGIRGAALLVMESKYDPVLYPLIDGRCIDVGDAFERRHGYRPSGLSVEGMWCFNRIWERGVPSALFAPEIGVGGVPISRPWAAVTGDVLLSSPLPARSRF